MKILTITKSQERIKHMISAYREIDKHGTEAKKFLFAQADEFTLCHPERIFEDAWYNGCDQKPVTLFD